MRRSGRGVGSRATRLWGWKSQSEKADDARVVGVGVQHGQTGRRIIRPCLRHDSSAVRVGWAPGRKAGVTKHAEAVLRRRRWPETFDEHGRVGIARLTGVAWSTRPAQEQLRQTRGGPRWISTHTVPVGQADLARRARGGGRPPHATRSLRPRECLIPDPS